MQPFENILDLTGLPRQWREPMQFAASMLNERLAEAGLKAWAGHDLELIAATQRAYPQRMRRLAECVDPRLHPRAGENDTLVVVLTREDSRSVVTVACTAIRKKWIETDLGDVLRRGLLFYDDPAMKPAAQRILCDAEVAAEIESAPIAWSGGTYVNADEDDIAFPAMMRLAFLWSLSRWRYQWIAGMCEYGLGIKPWAFRRLGMKRVDDGVARIDASGRTDYVLVTLRRRQLVSYVTDDAFADPSRDLGALA